MEGENEEGSGVMGKIGGKECRKPYGEKQKDGGGGGEEEERKSFGVSRAAHITFHLQQKSGQFSCKNVT